MAVEKKRRIRTKKKKVANLLTDPTMLKKFNEESNHIMISTWKYPMINKTNFEQKAKIKGMNRKNCN
jgi:hypothetical protein